MGNEDDFKVNRKEIIIDHLYISIINSNFINP
jgi:hypothetical protein